MERGGSGVHCHRARAPRLPHAWLYLRRRCTTRPRRHRQLDRCPDSKRAANPNSARVRVKRSTDHILTTHTGSLPRPNDLADLLMTKDMGGSVDEAAFERRVAEA